MQNLLERMRERVLCHFTESRMTTPIPRVSVAISRGTGDPESTMCGPGFCLVLQGTKRLAIGNRELEQDPGRSFASLVELPATRCLYETARREPYVAVGLTVDPVLLAELLTDLPPSPPMPEPSSFSVADEAPDLLEAWNQHLALLDAPGDIAALARPRERELLYRLLQSAHGGLLRQFVWEEGSLAQIRKAVDWLRSHFDQPVRVKTLAEVAAMSVPAFNRHFRLATATSPLQYQKALRLQAARQLLSKGNDVTRTAQAVGYESISQFSREYARRFERSPKQDALAMREGPPLPMI
ncbi:AraC family transcriptional regulator [Sphingomonas albertensis]|uniref:AraC family transcriptional regulator n=1 Tax=Sphingomonas albertensis TaxID=2762591 RepID=A0ABR7AKW5_9SPHN|nr:AraC family transcriptional regulator [Sphingomonas albertensis]MBC3941109.1 AraC family transcriptional regulator [Sphingomonas albertensis]